MSYASTLIFIFYFYLVNHLSNYATNKFTINSLQQTLLVIFFIINSLGSVP